MKYIVIMGITGSGKTTLENRLAEMGFKKNISYTTRHQEKNEKNFEDYIFVSKEKFMELYEEGQIIEYTEYAGNLYGTQRPFGSTQFVSVCEINGAKKLKEIFGNQIKIVYLDINKEVALRRIESRKKEGRETNNLEERLERDLSKVEEMKENADIILDATLSVNSLVIELLKYIH